MCWKLTIFNLEMSVSIPVHLLIEWVKPLEVLSLHNIGFTVKNFYESLLWFMIMSKLFILVAECQPSAVSSPNPDDPSGPPICADWQTGDFGPVMTVVYMQSVF